MKKTATVVLLTLLLVGLAFSVQKSIRIDREMQADYVIEESASPNRTHTIQIIGNGQPRWSFGSQKITVAIDDLATGLSTEIGNDGAEAIVRDIVWDGEDSAYIELGGRQPVSVKYSVKFEETGAVCVKLMPAA